MANSKIMIKENLVDVVENNCSNLDYVNRLIRNYEHAGNYDPFYVLDIGQIIRKHSEWCEQLPRVRPYYAIKSNPDPVMIGVLALLGCGFDVATISGIEIVLGMGVSPDRIVWSHPCKTPDHIYKASSLGVKKLVFDCESEMMKIIKVDPNVELILRIAVSDPSAEAHLNEKFGCDPEKLAPYLLKKAADINANVTGICFHIGTHGHDPTVYKIAITYCRHLFNLATSIGLHMKFLDIGGGFPGHENDASFENYGKTIAEALSEYFPPESNVDIISEPGFYFAKTPFTLCCTVVTRKDVQASDITKNDNDKHETGFVYHLNNGVFGSFRMTSYLSWQPMPKQCENNEMKYWSKVYGPACYEKDMIYEKVKWPKLEQGDRLIFENMGAYTMVFISKFSFTDSSTHYMITEQHANILMRLASRCPEGGKILGQAPTESSKTLNDHEGYVTLDSHIYSE